ncbi:MAG: hypothetical protein WBK47_04620, partial [Acetomicrobium sp.]
RLRLPYRLQKILGGLVMASKLRFSCPVRHQTFLKGGITLGAVFKLILGRFRAFQGFKRRSKAR